MPRPDQLGAYFSFCFVTLVKSSQARSRSSRLPVRVMKEERTARAWRYSSERSEESDGARWFSCGGWRSPKPWSVEKTSLQISDWTLTRSKEATLMEPPARTLWPGTSRSCQLRSKPFSERRKFPARTKLTRSFLPTLSGSSWAVGMVIKDDDGRTTRVDMRVRRVAMASARA